MSSSNFLTRLLNVSWSAAKRRCARSNLLRSSNRIARSLPNCSVCKAAQSLQSCVCSLHCLKRNVRLIPLHKHSSFLYHYFERNFPTTLITINTWTTITSCYTWTIQATIQRNLSSISANPPILQCEVLKQ